MRCEGADDDRREGYHDRCCEGEDDRVKMTGVKVKMIVGVKLKYK